MEQFDDINVESSTGYKPPTPFQFMFEKMVKDMRFVGMFTIIYGALNCLTIIGALLGVPTIIIGLRIREAADQFSIFRTTNDANAMRRGFELQGQYFKIIKILIIINLILIIISIVVFIILIAYFMSRYSDLMQMQDYST